MENEDGISLAWEGLLLLEVEFGEIVLEWGNIEHYLFMKKDKLTHGKILLNLVNSLLHHVTSAKIVKDAWDNFCATFDRWHVGNISQLRQKLYKLKMEKIECKLILTSFRWL
jgi:DNA-binding response OmpR family regulator